MSTGFQDHFNAVAAAYADFRPTYPAALYDWLASQCAQRELVWDCAAGSGQASVDLARHFARVVATDASPAQIADARPAVNVEYRVARAESSGLPDASCDLVTVAQALHWFDLPSFYAEARRVLKQGGVLAVWSYGVQHVDGACVDATVQRYYNDTVGPYWPPERVHVENGYRNLAFPFPQIDAPELTMQVQRTLEQLLGYLASWSATARYRAQTGHDPIPALRAELAAVWGDAAIARAVRWPLAIRAGRV
ncbi:MAG TPA: class I SAM-dependent methyltransferase [Burkholderiaceae bacterium]